MKTRIALLGALALTAVNALAAGTADVTATGALDNLKATYDSALPIGIGIMGTILAVVLVRRLWNRFAK